MDYELKDEEIDYIVSNRRKRMSWSEYTDYLILIGPLAFIFIGCLAGIYSFNDYEPFNEKLLHNALWISLIVVGILAFRFIIRRLRQNVSYTSVRTVLHAQENHTLIEAVLKDGGYDYKTYPRYLVIETRVSWTSWGESITVIPIDSEILINSHPKSGQPINIYRDAANVKNLKLAVEQKIQSSKNVTPVIKY